MEGVEGSPPGGVARRLASEPCRSLSRHCATLPTRRSSSSTTSWRPNALLAVVAVVVAVSAWMGTAAPLGVVASGAAVSAQVGLCAERKDALATFVRSSTTSAPVVSRGTLTPGHGSALHRLLAALDAARHERSGDHVAGVVGALGAKGLDTGSGLARLSHTERRVGSCRTSSGALRDLSDRTRPGTPRPLHRPGKAVTFHAGVGTRLHSRQGDEPRGGCGRGAGHPSRLPLVGSTASPASTVTPPVGKDAATNAATRP